jgi:hypothetical protein
MVSPNHAITPLFTVAEKSAIENKEFILACNSNYIPRSVLDKIAGVFHSGL